MQREGGVKERGKRKVEREKKITTQTKNFGLNVGMMTNNKTVKLVRFRLCQHWHGSLL